MSYFAQEMYEQPAILKKLFVDSPIKEAAYALRQRKPNVILSLARGSSDNAASFFAYLSGRYLGLPVASIPPSLFSVYQSQIEADKAVAIAISQSGESSDVVASIKALNQTGVMSISISNHPESSLAKASHYSLLQGAGLEKAVAASKTFSSQVMILALLAAYASESEELLNALKAVPEAMEALFADDTSIKLTAARLTHAESLYILGRGLSYAVALEIALKLKEMCYLHAQAYSSAEFQHGPIAAVDATDPVLLLALNDATLDSNQTILKKLKNIPADISLMSSLADLAKDVQSSIILKNAHPVTEAFLLIAAGQALALQLTLSKGLDPDKPRHLNKVTQTL
ncbi:MAG: SIS domain-containing protein [Deinococcales bacterium]